MSTTIDQRIVSMKFDNAGFSSGVKETLSDLQGLDRKLEKSASGSALSGLQSSINSITFEKMAQNIDSIASHFTVLGRAWDMTLGQMLYSASKWGLDTAKAMSVDNVSAGFEKFGQKTTSVSTLLSQGFELDEIETQLEKLNWFSDETSYSFTDMVDNIAKFTASGQDLEDSSTALMGIANWAAMSGQNAQTASRAMYQLSQAMGAGVMRKQDYMSVQNANMDTRQFRELAIQAALARGTLKELSEGVYKSTVGKKDDEFTIDQFTEQLTAGAWFTSDVMMDVYSQYAAAVDQIYSYVSDNDVETTSQAIEQMEATGVAIDEFGKTAFLAAQQARTWTDVIDSVKDAASTGWMNIFSYIFGNTEETIKLFTDMANELWEVFVGPIATISDLMKEWYDFGGRTYLWEGLGALWSNLTGILNVFGDALGIIFPIFEEGQGIVAADGTKAFADYMKSISLTDEELTTLADTLAGLMLPITWLFDLIKQVWGVIKPSLVTDLGNAFDFVGTKLQELSAFFTGADVEVKGFNGYIASLVDGLMHFAHGGFMTTFVKLAEVVYGELTGAFMGLGKAFVYVKGKAKELKDGILGKLMKVFKAVSNRVQFAFDAFMRIPEAISFVWGIVKNAFGEIWNVVKQFVSFEKIAKVVGTAFSVLFGGIYVAIMGASSIGDFFFSLGKSIANFFVGIYKMLTSSGGFAGFITAVKEKIIAAFTSIKEGISQYIDVDKFLKIIANTFKYLNDSFAKLTGIDIAKIFQAIGNVIKKITKPFTRLKFVVDELKTLFSGLPESFKQFFDFKSLFGSVGEAIDNFWKTVHEGITDASKFGEIVDAVGKAFSTLGSTIREKFLEKIKIGDFFADFKLKADEFVSGIISGFTGIFLGFSTAADGSQESVKKLEDELDAAADPTVITVFADIRKTIELAKEALIEFVKSIGSKITSSFSGLIKPVEKIGKAFKTLGDNAKKAFPNIKELAKKHIKLKGAIDDAKKAFGDFHDKFWEAFSGKKAIPDRIEEVKKAFGELVDDVKKSFGENLDFKGIWEDFSTTFTELKDNIGEFFKTDVKTFFDDATKGASDLWKEIKPYEEDTLWEALVKNAGNVKDAFGKAKENAQGLVDALKETSIYQTAADSINSMVQAIEGTTVFKVVAGAISAVQQGLSDLVHTIKESDTGIKLAEIWTTFIESLSQTDWTTPSTAISSISTSIGSMLTAMNGLRVEKFTELMNSIDAALEGTAEKFVGVYNMYMYLKNFKYNVALLVRQGVEGFADGIAEADWDTIIDRAMAVVGFVVVLRLLAFINQIGETAGMIGTIAKNVKKFTSQLNSILMGTKWLFMAEMFKGLALAVVAIAGALFVLAAVPEDDLYKAVAAITAIILAFTLLAFVKGAFSKVKDATSDAAGVKDKIETLRDAVGALADAVKEGLKKATLFFSVAFLVAAIGFVAAVFVQLISHLAGIPWDVLWENLGKLGIVLLTVVGVVAILGFVAKRAGSVSWETAAVIVSIGAMLWIVAQSFKIFDSLQPGTMSNGLSAMFLILLGTAAVLYAMSKLPDKTTIYAMIGLLGAIAAFMLLMMIPVAILSTIAQSGGLLSAMLGIAGLAIVVLAMVGAMTLMAKTLTSGQMNIVDLGAIAAALVVVALTLVIAAGAMMMLASIPSDKIGGAIGAFTVILVALGGLLIVMAIIAGTLSTNMTALLGIGVAVAALIGISVAVLILATAIGVIADVCSSVADSSNGDIAKTIGTMVGSLIIFLALVGVLAFVVQKLHLGAALIEMSIAVLLVSASLLVLGYAAGALAAAAPAFMNNFKDVALTLVTLAAALLVLGLIGKFTTPGLLAIAAVLGTVALIIIAITAAMVIFATIVPETFGQTLDDLMGRADQVANVIAAIIYALAVGLVRGIAAALPPIIEALGQMLGQLWILLVQGLAWMVQGIADWIVNDGPSRLLQAIMIVIDTILIAVLEVLGPIAEFFGGTTEGLIDDLEAKVTERAAKAGYNTGKAAVEGTQKGLDETPLDYSKIQETLGEGGELTFSGVEVTGADNANAIWNSFTGGIGPNPLDYSGIIVLPGAEQGAENGKAYGDAYGTAATESAAETTAKLNEQVVQATVNTNEAAGARSGEAYGKTYDPTLMSTTAETTAKVGTSITQSTVEANATAGTESGQAYTGSYKDTFAGFTQDMQDVSSQTGIDMGSLIVAGNAEGMTSSSGELTGAIQTMNASIANGFGGLDLTSVADGNMEDMLGEYADYAPDMTNTASLLNLDFTGELANADTAGAAELNIGNYTGVLDGHGVQSAASSGSNMGTSGASALGQTSPAYYTSASHVVDGAVQGINDNMSKYIQAVVNMATEGNKEFNKANQVKSPSRLFAGSTRWVVLGAAQGVKDNADVYISSLTDMAARSNSAFSGALADLGSFDYSSLDVQPTITPVLDMSNVRTGMSNVGGMLNGNLGTVTAGINFTSRFDEMNTYASQLAAASRQGNGTLLAAIERQTRRTEELISAVRQGGKIYLNGKTLVGGILGDIDSGLGAKTERWARGV